MRCLHLLSPNIFLKYGLINTFVVFALGYLARPLGGMMFGHMEDKFGRKSAFSLAVFIMATSLMAAMCS